MEIVQPIRDINQIHQIENILKAENMRDYILFRLGIYSGLRISDILKLKVSDLRGQDYFLLREKKTGKAKKQKFTPSLKKDLDEYLKNKSSDEYIIKSQKGDNQPITRIQAYRILNKVAARVGINGEIGCHTMRKTFGYHFYNQFNDSTGKGLTFLQEIFNHSTPHVTLRYIGIRQDDVDALFDTFDYDNIEPMVKNNKKLKRVI